MESVVHKLKDLHPVSKAVNYLLVSLQDKLEGKLTMQELTDYCLRWSYHNAFKELVPIEMPEPSEKIKIFNNWSEPKRKKAMEDSDIKYTVLKYRSKYIWTLWQNKANKSWLEEMLKLFKKTGEIVKVGKIEEVLRNYDEPKSLA